LLFKLLIFSETFFVG